MATTKPRVTITFEPATYALLKELASLNHQSLSRVIGELLDTMVPTVQRVVIAGKHFQTLSDDMKAQVRRDFDEAEAVVLPEVDRMQAEFLALLGDIEARPATEDPRRVTRGSRPPTSNPDHSDNGVPAQDADE